MANGIALLVGLRQVDPQLHGGWDGTSGCWGCELDVDNIEHILRPIGYQITTLKTEQATHDNIIQALKSAAEALKPEDIFIFYFSGHGGQQPDFNSDEMDGKDETLVAYDRDIVDDELNEIWLSFKKGTRIVMISDSCNSGTNYKNVRDITTASPIALIQKGALIKMEAQMIHFGGCRDGFTSSGYLGGGAFTIALCNVWQNGSFLGDYPKFFRAIWKKTPDQDPQYNEYGMLTDKFRDSQVFKISDDTRIDVTFTLSADSLKTAKEVIEKELDEVILKALDDSLKSERPGSFGITGSAHGDEEGYEWEVSGTFTYTF